MPHAYPTVARLDHVMLSSPAPEALADFYCTAMKMRRLPDVGGAIVCAGPERTMLFARGSAGALGFGAFAFATSEELARKRAELAGRGVNLIASPSPLFDESAFALRDIDGNVIVFGVRCEQCAAPTSYRARLQHLVVASPDPARLASFYSAMLGFWPSDRVVDDEGEVRSIWLRSDEEHHSFAIFRADTVGVDHHSYELEDWGGMRDWADYFSANRIELIWGPGRHGPGNNLFIFVRDPDGNKIELSAELERVSVHRPLGTWPYDRMAFNLWGSAPLRVAGQNK